MQSKSWNKYFDIFISYVSNPVIYSCPLVFQISHVPTTLEEECYLKKAEKFQKTKFCNNNGLDIQAYKTTQAERGGESSFHKDLRNSRVVEEPAFLTLGR